MPLFVSDSSAHLSCFLEELLHYAQFVEVILCIPCRMQCRIPWVQYYRTIIPQVISRYVLLPFFLEIKKVIPGCKPSITFFLCRVHILSPFMGKQRLISGNTLNKPLHPVGTFGLHSISYMTVNIQREGCCCVAEIILDSFDVITGCDGGNCVAMP